ncbi:MULTISPECIES: DoxX family protein [Stenotrophomonas]|uniref:DoxX family protein n=1 Tax=Stenotrophomonas TaxID=40323 RepID=UPI00066C3BA2|nr:MULTISPECIES: DoxX family protein [Stenotrophomonas]
MILGYAVHDLLAWGLSIFFVVGAIGNWLGPANLRAEYARWGYPNWFHRVTAALEFLIAIFLVFVSTRLGGCALGGVVMLAAIGTLLRHAEYKHALLPTAVLLLLGLLGFLTI